MDHIARTMFHRPVNQAVSILVFVNSPDSYDQIVLEHLVVLGLASEDLQKQSHIILHIYCRIYSVDAF